MPGKSPGQYQRTLPHLNDTKNGESSMKFLGKSPFTYKPHPATLKSLTIQGEGEFPITNPHVQV